MRVVLASKVPAVFTAYTEFEVRNDTNLLLDLGASFMKTWELNRGWCYSITERMEVYGLDHFLNHYRLIVRGR
jgi:hypothetical protein